VKATLSQWGLPHHLVSAFLLVKLFFAKEKVVLNPDILSETSFPGLRNFLNIEDSTSSNIDQVMRPRRDKNSN